MKYKNIIYVCLAIIIGILLLYRFVSVSPTIQTQKQNTNLTQTNSEGAVTVKATPKELTKDKQVLFQIILDTHSVDLNYDLANIAKLVDNDGNVYKPLSWTGGKGGHHVEGVLTFPAIVKSATKITLTISAIDNKERVFEWDIK